MDDRSSAAGLRAVAVYEALKGVIVLALATGLLALLHKDVESFAENLLVHLHINLDRRIAQVVLNAASKMTDTRLWGLAIGAMAYSAVRFTEAWGLWHRRVWAEWFALLSGALYLPLEIVKLTEHRNAVHAAVFLGNLALVLYMLYIRVEACRDREYDEPANEAVEKGRLPA